LRPAAEISCHLAGGSDRGVATRSGDPGPAGPSGGTIVNNAALSRIPFRVRDEMTILSMARWMRFVAAIKVIGGILTIFVVLVAVLFIGAVIGGSPTAESGTPSVNVTVGDKTERVPPAKVHRVISENPITFGALGAFAMLLAVAGTVLGFVLYQAADDFDRVARTDVADQDYIAEGITRLNTYFKVSILLGVTTVLVAITAAIGLAARYSTGP
jgi:hypothetical protein